MDELETLKDIECSKLRNCKDKEGNMDSKFG